jgi:hypothetical protein
MKAHLRLVAAVILALFSMPAYSQQIVGKHRIVKAGGGGGAPTVTVVQHKYVGSSSTGATLALTVTATAAGNMIVAAGFCASPTQTMTITDNATGGANTYTGATSSIAIGGAGDWNQTEEMFTTLGGTHGGATTVTLTCSGSNGGRSLEAWEVHASSGTWALATSNNNRSVAPTGAASPFTETGPGLTVSGASTSWFCGAFQFGSTVLNNPATGSVWTSGGDIDNVFGDGGAISFVTSTGGTYTPSWNTSNKSINFSTTAACYSVQ